MKSLGLTANLGINEFKRMSTQKMVSSPTNIVKFENESEELSHSFSNDLENQKVRIAVNSSDLYYQKQ